VEDYVVIEVIIPNLGATGEDVILEEWLVKPGDFVKNGAPLFVVTTDKATVEVEAYQSGYVRQLLAEPGTKIPLGARVALLTSTAEEPLDASMILDSDQLETSKRLKPESRPDRPYESRSLGRILASPLARRMAREADIELRSLTGSGRHGEILKRDVLQVVQGHPQGSSAGLAASALYRRVPLTAMRRSIAKRTRLSKAEAPHFYATATIDMEAAKEFLAQTKTYAQKRSWPVPTLTDLVLRATALALRQVPQINVSFQGEEIFAYEEINIGLAIGLPDGMVIPVVHNADRKNLYTLAVTTQRLKSKSLGGGLSASDLLGGTFTLSNLGMFGLDSFVAVLNPPEAGILALGAVRKVPTVWMDQIVPRWSMTANLSVDHRVVDGVVAARFMEELRMLLENPVSLALEAPQEFNE
jgi:pyruvate dehydrogenase E2 component (dihydrolipoamide acetyltransferase)